MIAIGVAAMLLAGTVTGFLLLRPEEVAAPAVTDPQATTGALAATGGHPPTVAAGSAPAPTQPGAGPVSSARTSAPTSATAGTSTFAPAAAGATADCSAPDSVDAAGVAQSYAPSKAFDGKRETAWRCSGDASGRSIVIDLGAPVQLTSVGLIPGFDKVDSTDGADRFTQSRKVLRVRWTFDDGSSVETNAGGQRAVASSQVSVRTRKVTMTIGQTAPGSTVTNNQGEALAPLDTTAVSEILLTAVG